MSIYFTRRIADGKLHKLSTAKNEKGEWVLWDETSDPRHYGDGTVIADDDPSYVNDVLTDEFELIETHYLFEIDRRDLADYRQTLISEKLVSADPDGYTCDTRAQGEAIAARNNWEFTCSEVPGDEGGKRPIDVGNSDYRCITGQRYDLERMTLVGWHGGGDDAENTLYVGNYFHHGVYQGADSDGVEPIFRDA